MTALTLADFLRARLGEDEAVAREARAAAVENDTVREDVSREHEIDPVSDSQWGPSDDVYMSTARVLADVEAKRRIVDEHSDQPGWPHECQGWVLDGQRRDVGFWENCPTLRLLALPYASHPDYRQEWKP